MKHWLTLSTAGIALALSTQAAAQPSRTVLPIPATPFTGTIADNIVDSTSTPARPVQAPAGAPNIFVMMGDDTGFAMSSAFGGPVPTPNYERLANQGQRYNRFHTTAICSPSRAALLTGRNHHNAGVGWLSDVPLPYPGYSGEIHRETATLAQILRLNGYNTAMFGKHHNTPGHLRSPAGPFDSWPTGIGFEYFYGFIAGDSDQYRPVLYRDTQLETAPAKSGELLDKRLADDIIEWVHNQKASAPDKPFYVYFSTGSTHAPHQAPPEYIARFKGRFDQGWDKIREEIYHRQIAMGIIPRGTKLTPRPPEIPAWDSLTPGQKAFARRTMEVAAAQLAYQDAQVGRVLAELERMGELENTLVTVILGDNGASAETGPKGTINEMRAIGLGSLDENEVWMQANTDKLGGPETYPTYPVGWTWAMDTPLRWTKQYASMLGGIRNGMIMAWGNHVQNRGGVCSEFSHLIDIAPTALDAANLPAPEMVLGTKQKPMDGQSLLPGLTKCDAAKPRTQYFEIGGKIGLYDNGWFLSGDDGRVPWVGVPPTGLKPEMTWTLYDLRKDFSQSTDIAAKYPQRLEAMKELWRKEANKNNVFPLEHRFAGARAIAAMQAQGATGGEGMGKKHYVWWGKNISIPPTAGPILLGRSFTINADLMLESASASGAVIALGSYFGGWSLYLDHGHPAFIWARSTDPNEIQKVRSDKTLPQGITNLKMRFAVEKPGGPAVVTLTSNGNELGTVNLPTSILAPTVGGETLDTGRDIGVPVTDYATPQGAIEGEISRITIDFD